MKIIIWICLFCLVLELNLFSNEVDARVFKELIKSTYDFSPSKLTKKEQKLKIPSLDKFFKLVKSDKKKYIPLLKKELQNFSHNNYFLFDGASLLFGLSKSKADLQICADAIAHADLKELQCASYFYFTMDLGKNGIDTYGAIENMLNDSSFKLFIAKHFLTLKQNWSVLYCCLQLDEKLYVDKLIKRLKTEKNHETIKTIVLVLQCCVSEKAYKAIQQYTKKIADKELIRFIDNFKMPDESKFKKRKLTSKKSDIKHLLKSFQDRSYALNDSLAERIKKDLPYLVTKKDYANIKKTRREMAYRISDEAIEEIAFLTHLLKISFVSK